MNLYKYKLIREFCQQHYQIMQTRNVEIFKNKLSNLINPDNLPEKIYPDERLSTDLIIFAI